MKWKAVINGRRSINGARYSATITGDGEMIDGSNPSAYTALLELATHLEEANKEMQFPDSLQVTVWLNEKPEQNDPD